MVVMAVVVAMMRGVALEMRMTRILAEHQRFDRDRNRVGRQPNASEIDVIEIPERYAIDHQELVRDLHLFAKDRAERLGDVAIKHDEQWLAGRDRLGEAGGNSLRERQNPLIGRRSVPAQREGDIAL